MLFFESTGLKSISMGVASLLRAAAVSSVMSGVAPGGTMFCPTCKAVSPLVMCPPSAKSTELRKLNSMFAQSSKPIRN